MSQPPQQPGPWGGQPGFGGQPGPGQQPSGFPSQGGYPPPGGYPQQGGFPPPGAQPQYPNGYGQPAQYGQSGPYGHPGGYGYGPQKKSQLPWIVGIGGVAVVALVVVLVLVVTSGGGTSSPEGVAQAAVDAANAKDYAKVADLACNANAEDVKDSVDPKSSGLPDRVELRFTLGRVEKISDTEATAEVKLKIGGDLPAGVPESITETSGKMNLRNEDDGWCISGMG